MKITKFDRPTLKATRLQDRTVEALKALAEEFGLTVEAAGGTIDDAKLVLKVAFKVNDPDATAQMERDRFVDYCTLYGLKPEHFGGRFLHKGRPFTVVGIEPSRPKFCVKARDENGKMLLFPQTVAAKVQPAKAA